MPPWPMPIMPCSSPSRSQPEATHACRSPVWNVALRAAASSGSLASAASGGCRHSWPCSARYLQAVEMEMEAGQEDGMGSEGIGGGVAAAESSGVPVGRLLDVSGSQPLWLAQGAHGRKDHLHMVAGQPRVLWQSLGQHRHTMAEAAACIPAGAGAAINQSDFSGIHSAAPSCAMPPAVQPLTGRRAAMQRASRSTS